MHGLTYWCTEFDLDTNYPSCPDDKESGQTGQSSHDGYINHKFDRIKNTLRVWVRAIVIGWWIDWWYRLTCKCACAVMVIISRAWQLTILLKPLIVRTAARSAPMTPTGEAVCFNALVTVILSSFLLRPGLGELPEECLGEVAILNEQPVCVSFT